MAALIVREPHSACQAQFVGRRGENSGAVPHSGMAQNDLTGPQRAPTFMKEWRKFKKLTQEQAAERVDLDRTTYLRIEAGKLPYNQDFLEKLAFGFGCEVADLLSVNPLLPDPPKLVYDKLRRAPPELQRQALDLLDVLLRGAA